MDETMVELGKNDQMYLAWQRCNKMVVSWILHFIFEQIRQSVLRMTRLRISGMIWSSDIFRVFHNF